MTNHFLRKRTNCNFSNLFMKRKESKYIRKVGCSVPSYLREDENVNNVNSQIAENKDETKICSIESQNVKKTKHQLNGSLNGDEWELFFVIDESATDKNANDQQVVKAKNSSSKNDINMNKTVKEDKKTDFDQLDLEDYEWDDFLNDETTLSYDEQDQLIEGKQS